MDEMNLIDLRCDEAVKDKIEIIMNGRNNQVVIDEFVQVEEALSILINDDDNMIFIGRGTTFEKSSISIADNKNKVIIGEDCMFARDSQIIASDFHTIFDLKTGKRINMSKGVIIDNHVWIGYGAVILKNTHIYSNSIVGAGTVVNGNILANSIFRTASRFSFMKRTKETTWERQREAYVCGGGGISQVRKGRFYKVPINDDIVVHIEGNMAPYFNKIRGWVVWKEKELRDRTVLIKFFWRKGNKKKHWLVSCPIIKRSDVAEYFEDEKYLFSGFDSYMPSEIINNYRYIYRVELIVNNGSEIGRQVILKGVE